MDLASLLTTINTTTILVLVGVALLLMNIIYGLIRAWREVLHNKLAGHADFEFDRLGRWRLTGPADLDIQVMAGDITGCALTAVAQAEVGPA